MVHLGSGVDADQKSIREQAILAGASGGGPFAGADYRSLIERSPVGVAVASLDGVLLDANEAWFDLWGQGRDVLGGLLSELMPGDAYARFSVDAVPLLRGDVDHVDSELRLVRPDGTELWTEALTTLVRDPKGHPQRLVCYLRDVTARRKVEDALRHSEALYRSVVDALQEGIVIQDRALRIVRFNQSAPGILGLSDDELAGRAPLDPRWRTVRTDGSALRQEERPSTITMRTGTPLSGVVLGVHRPDGSLRWLSVTTRPVFTGGEDRPELVVTTFADITERKSAEDALRASEAMFRGLAESLPVAVYQAGTDGLCTYVNPKWEEITDVPAALAPSLGPLDVVHPDDRQSVKQAMLDAGRTDRYHARYRIRTRDGSVRWVHSRAVPVRDADGETTSFVGSMEDVTAVLAAQEETARLAAILESTTDFVGVSDRRGRMVYLNRAARDAFNIAESEVTALTTTEIYTPESLGRLRNEVARSLLRGRTWTGELAVRSPDGELVQIEQTVMGERTPDGKLVRISSVGRDVTAQRRLEALLAHQATHDPLTGLPNRTLLLEHLEFTIERATRLGRAVAVLFLDLDRFKVVNDRVGHEAGDELLGQVARRLTEVVRPADTVARLGGDEFVVVCDDVDEEQEALAVANRILAALESPPFKVVGGEVTITASLGIAVSAGGVNHPEGLLREADAAMYRAKEQGRARLELFDEAMRAQASRRARLADELSRGLERGELVLHYQPTVDLATGRVVSLEALARWHHPGRGLIGPSEFIELAEQTGLITALGESMLRLACEQLRDWAATLPGLPPVIHVNLSPRQLATSELTAMVQAETKRAGVDPGWLCLEITENALMDDAAGTAQILRELKEVGVSIAIDDFGTGYSSLSYLKRFPVDVLKVDRSFIDGLGPDPEDSAIVAAIIRLAHTLDLLAIAEGVETEVQLEKLRALGCDAAQGYLFARPVAPEGVLPLLGRVFP